MSDEADNIVLRALGLFNTGALAIIVVLGAFLGIVFGINWLADAIPAFVAKLPPIAQTVLKYAAFAAIAIGAGKLISRRKSAQGDRT